MRRSDIEVDLVVEYAESMQYRHIDASPYSYLWSTIRIMASRSTAAGGSQSIPSSTSFTASPAPRSNSCHLTADVSGDRSFRKHAYTGRARSGPSQPPAQVAHLSARCASRKTFHDSSPFQQRWTAIAMLPFCVIRRQ